jgi:hypothetical protein
MEMDTRNFDLITSSFTEIQTRRGALRLLAAAAFGVGGATMLGIEQSDAKKKRKKKGGSRSAGNGGGSSNAGSGGSGNGEDSGVGGSGNGGATGNQIVGGDTPNHRCGGPVGICNADPTPCGTVAGGGICGCERSVEGNNVCVNSGADNVCDFNVECTSTSGDEATSCRNLVGFHFYCQEAKTNSTGQFCGCGFGTTTGRVCVPECDNATQY